VITLLIWLLVLALPAQAASFDCAKAESKVEKLICSDAGLSQLDEELNTAYKTAMQDVKHSDSIKQAQKQWMKERNSCSDVACVKVAYETWLSSLTVKNISSNDDASIKQGANTNFLDDQQYQFQLTKGSGVPVCDAYLERLNKSEYDKPPYCDRPENDSVKGFAKLNRVPLSPADVHDLYPIVWSFMLSANQPIFDWHDMKFQQKLTQSGQHKLSEEGAKLLQMDIDAGSAKMWRYDPPIDIDNDGVPDNVEVWHGIALPIGVGGRQCGDDAYPIFPSGTVLRQPQVALVVSGNNDRLDAFITVKIFGHPKEGYRLTDGSISDKFRPIGRTIGIFKYQDIYYFDTFFDGWGDIENKRKKNEDIVNTLAVFLHQGGKTKQICEYLMTDNKTQGERGKK